MRQIYRRIDKLEVSDNVSSVGSVGNRLFQLTDRNGLQTSLGVSLEERVLNRFKNDT